MDAIYAKLEKMTDGEIDSIWESLRGYDPLQMYDAQRGISMDDWAGAVYSVISQRGTNEMSNDTYEA